MFGRPWPLTAQEIPSACSVLLPLGLTVSSILVIRIDAKAGRWDVEVQLESWRLLFADTGFAIVIVGILVAAGSGSSGEGPLSAWMREPSLHGCTCGVSRSTTIADRGGKSSEQKIDDQKTREQVNGKPRTTRQRS